MSRRQVPSKKSAAAAADSTTSDALQAEASTAAMDSTLEAVVGHSDFRVPVCSIGHGTREDRSLKRWTESVEEHGLDVTSFYFPDLRLMQLAREAVIHEWEEVDASPFLSSPILASLDASTAAPSSAASSSSSSKSAEDHLGPAGIPTLVFRVPTLGGAGVPCLVSAKAFSSVLIPPSLRDEWHSSGRLDFASTEHLRHEELLKNPQARLKLDYAESSTLSEDAVKVARREYVKQRKEEDLKSLLNPHESTVTRNVYMNLSGKVVVFKTRTGYCDIAHRHAAEVLAPGDAELAAATPVTVRSDFADTVKAQTVTSPAAGKSKASKKKKRDVVVIEPGKKSAGWLLSPLATPSPSLSASPPPAASLAALSPVAIRLLWRLLGHASAGHQYERSAVDVRSAGAAGRAKQGSDSSGLTGLRCAEAQLSGAAQCRAARWPRLSLSGRARANIPASSQRLRPQLACPATVRRLGIQLKLDPIQQLLQRHP